MKIICFGVREYEVSIFKQFESEYEHTFELKDIYIDETNYKIAYGYEAMIIRANCILSKQALKDLADHGLKYLLTRTIGYDHILLDECEKNNIKVAYAPGYSPTAIAEIAVTMTLMLLRNIPEAVVKATKYDFRLDKNTFGKEIRNCTVGIIGCGRIGKTAASMFKALGAKIIGYDVNFNIDVEDLIEYKNLDSLLKEADIVSIHMPYIKGENENFINDEKISLMKDDSVLINTSRGELVETAALIKYIKSGKLRGVGLDVLEKEKELFFKKHTKETIFSLHKELIDLHPRVIITPHISSSTDMAVYDSVKISLDNLDEFIKTRNCKNELKINS